MSTPKEGELPQHDKMNLTGSNIQAESLILKHKLHKDIIST